MLIIFCRNLVSCLFKSFVRQIKFFNKSTILKVCLPTAYLTTYRKDLALILIAIKDGISIDPSKMLKQTIAIIYTNIRIRIMEKRHYFTPSEKKEFLKILKKYSSIIENKGTDNDSARRKNIAWNRIACEYNTSSTAPYPASSKQLRRLWMNLKFRNKQSLAKLKQGDLKLDERQDAIKQDESPSEADFPNDDTLDGIDVEEEISTPFFVNVGSGENHDDSLKTRISEGNTQESKTFTTTDSEGRAFDVEFIDDIEEVQSKTEAASQKELNRVKNNIVMREFHDRRRRQNELHILQKRLLMEQIREAKAKASLAELELRQQQYLAS